MFSENSFEVNAVDEYIKESILVLDDYYKNCNYIMNPQAINKCVILQEKVKALVELQHDDEIIVEEQFKILWVGHIPYPLKVYALDSLANQWIYLRI